MNISPPDARDSTALQGSVLREATNKGESIRNLETEGEFVAVLKNELNLLVALPLHPGNEPVNDTNNTVEQAFRAEQLCKHGL